MKLNKSHVLLISLISIFLLLSVSAVSAADDADSQLLSENTVSDVVVEDVDNQLLSENTVSDVVVDDVDEIGDKDKDANKLSQVEETIISDDEDAGDDGGDDGGDDAGDGDDPSDEATPTTIESNNETYKYGENITVNVTVKDNESNPLNITKENLEVFKITFNGTDYNSTNITGDVTLNNESKLVLKQLKVGDYILALKFLGNATYQASETNITLNITKTDTTLNASDIKVKLGDDVIIPVIMKVESNKTLSVNASSIKVYIGETEYNCTNETGGNNITKNIKVLNFTQEIGNYSVVIKYLGNDNCNPSEAAIVISILANNTIKTNDTVKVNNRTKNVTVPIVITNTNITTYYDEETEKNVTNVTVTNMTVTKDDLILLLTYDNGTDNETIEITDYDLNGDVGNYTINFTTEYLNSSKLTILFANGTYNETSKNVTLIGTIFAKIIPITVAADYQDGNFSFKLVDADTGDILSNTNITIRGVNFYSFINGSSISPSKLFTSDSNGIVLIKNINMSPSGNYDFNSFVYNFTTLPAGKYNLTFQGVDNAVVYDGTVEITVNKATAKIVASDYTQEVGSGVKYNFKLVNSNTNQPIKLTPLKFKVKIGSNYSIYNTTTNMTGQCSFSINLIVGSYPVTIESNSSNVKKATISKTIKIVKKQAVLSASNRTLNYGNGPSAVIKLTDKKTGKAVANAIVKVRLYKTSKDYVDLAFSTDKSGSIKFNVALSVGKHKLIISTLDNNYTATTITRYVTIKKVSGKFTASNIKTFYRSGKVYSVKVTNAKTNKAIFGAKTNIKIFISKTRYYNYTGTTDGNGKINLKANLKPGTYKVVISAYDNGYTAKSITRKITVTKHPVRMLPTSLKVKRGNYFRVKVVSRKTKKVLSSVNVRVRVYTGRTYKTYTVKTNKKGIASLRIIQRPGRHRIIITNPATKLYSAASLKRTLAVTR